MCSSCSSTVQVGELRERTIDGCNTAYQFDFIDSVLCFIYIIISTAGVLGLDLGLVIIEHAKPFRSILL